MQKRLSSALAACLLVGASAIGNVGSIAAQAKPASGTPGLPKVGELAPDFKLNYFDGNDLKSVSLSQYRGKKNVVVAFFIFAFTGG
ncbi:MAG: hypothetical protein WB523_10210 [Candidatus Sulfotelmatobacter sp.]